MRQNLVFILLVIGVILPPYVVGMNSFSQLAYWGLPLIFTVAYILHFSPRSWSSAIIVGAWFIRSYWAKETLEKIDRHGPIDNTISFVVFMNFTGLLWLIAILIIIHLDTKKDTPPLS